jgi:hypothetical protein
MARKSTKVIPKPVKTTRGPRGKGKDPLIALRLPPVLIKRVDAWAKENGLSRSAAVRRFIEQGIGGASRVTER